MRKVSAVVILVATGLLLGATVPPAATDVNIGDMVAGIFKGRPDDRFVSVVLRDPANRQYVAFHISTYLDVKELRVYVVPFVGADTEAVDAAIAKGDHEAAFQKVINDLRIDLGARYVADVALDGIRDADVPLGQGRMRDNFHREHFGSFDAANVAYVGWLRRGLALVGD